MGGGGPRLTASFTMSMTSCRVKVRWAGGSWVEDWRGSKDRLSWSSGPRGCRERG